MLDHLSIQCSHRQRTFYDVVLAPLGGRRVMDWSGHRLRRATDARLLIGRTKREGLKSHTSRRAAAMP